MDYVGSDWKQRVIERVLGISGKIFYHLFLRPKEYLDNRKKDKNSVGKGKRKGA